MYALCLRYARCHDDADDIFQDAFYKVYTNLHTFGFNGSLEGWIRRIFINTAVSHYRNEIRTIALPEVNETEDETVDNEPDLLKNISLQSIMEMINRLPEGYRLVFNMYAIDGLSHKDIAGKLGIQENTSKSQLYKARKKLQEMIRIHQKNNAENEK